ncbi:unnamed protein product [Pleuronectes platessa]|uniref:Uncharacterized protein n=1 Tax=Pleuronectes platessa TaxID=8262 RepID=A0A9N7VCD1_PLEPL|nr:unnamed protein product [Pleuronectes platessa]
MAEKIGMKQRGRAGECQEEGEQGWSDRRLEEWRDREREGWLGGWIGGETEKLLRQTAETELPFHEQAHCIIIQRPDHTVTFHNSCDRSCVQVISVCSDGRSPLIGLLNSYADVKIAGCVCQKANPFAVVTL